VHYELTNHLGNVLATISDRKLGFQNGETFYRSDVLSLQDYYAFGMEMPDRTYNQNAYKYSINGQEKDTDIDANHTTALYWEYDSRIGRRWNIDPVVKEWESGYACFGDNPISGSDPDGDETASGGPAKDDATVFKDAGVCDGCATTPVQLDAPVVTAKRIQKAPISEPRQAPNHIVVKCCGICKSR
jgi:hypothetical protein